MTTTALRWQPLPEDESAVGGTDGALVYAIGDIHGCYTLLTRLLAGIAEDAATRAEGRQPILVLCGDYIDRGPASAAVIEAIGWLKTGGPYAVRALRGNHEQAMLDFLDDPFGDRNWLRFGGEETLLSYGVEPPADESLGERIRVRDQLVAAMPVAHRRLIEKLEPMVEIGDYVFVHAGIRPGRALADQKLKDLLWIRTEFLEYGETFPKAVVHGHSWQSSEPQIMTNRIGIDTGAFATDILTTLRLDGTTRAYAQTIEEMAAA